MYTYAIHSIIFFLDINYIFIVKLCHIYILLEVSSHQFVCGKQKFIICTSVVVYLAILYANFHILMLVELNAWVADKSLIQLNQHLLNKYFHQCNISYFGCHWSSIFAFCQKYPWKLNAMLLLFK